MLPTPLGLMLSDHPPCLVVHQLPGRVKDLHMHTQGRRARVSDTGGQDASPVMQVVVRCTFT